MPRIPAMTIGISDFMIRPGRLWPIPVMPTPDLAVPYAAPKSDKSELTADGDRDGDAGEARKCLRSYVC
jgi:hypothetical protein